MTRNSGRVTNMLMVTTTVRMVNGIHGDTTDARPVVLLDLVLVVGTTSLEDGLVDATTTGNNTDLATSKRVDGLLGARGQTDAGLADIGVVTNDGGVVTRATGSLSTVSSNELDVVDGGTFGDLSDGEDVSNRETSLLTTVDELTSVHAFSGNDDLMTVTVFVGVFELNASKRSATARIVHDLLDYSANVSFSLSKIKSSVFGSALTGGNVSSENTTSTSTLASNDSSHFFYTI